jgi:hypothetical protein
MREEGKGIRYQVSGNNLEFSPTPLLPYSPRVFSFSEK